MGNKKLLLTEVICQPELLDAQLQTALPALPKIANPRLLIHDTQPQNSLKIEAGDKLCNLNLQTHKIYFSHHWKILLDYQEPEISDSPSEWLQRIHPDQVKNVFRFIETNYRSQISLREVAQAVGYSCAYLTNLVQQETGKSVNQWIKEYRMKEARILLLETNQLIKQIAVAVGYQGTEHFIRQFRQVHGLTPKNWRNQQRS